MSGRRYGRRGRSIRGCNRRGNECRSNGTEREAHVTAIAGTRTALTLVHTAAARCSDNRMAAEAAAYEATTNDAMNADATDVEAHVTTIAETHTALTRCRQQ